MTEESGPPPPEPTAQPVDDSDFWTRVREHKIIQWGVAYLGAALAVAQGHQFIAGAFGWPNTADRILVAALMVGFPVALTLAWYHGHRGLKRITAGELTIISVLMLIGGVFFTVAIRPPSGAQGSALAPDARPETSNAARSTANAGATQAEVLPNSVAVLPCANQSPSPDDAIFAAGIHEEILLQLSKLRNLNATPRRGVLRYAETDLGIRQIASELGVQAVMDCSVRYAENRVRISAELIDGQSERSIWSDVYERDLAGVFAIQADIAMNIANAVGAEFSAAEQAQLERPLTTSPEAYRLYMQSRALVANQSPDSIRQAKLLRDRALELDPNFAWARAARVLGEASDLVDGTQNQPYAFQTVEAERLVRQEIERALALEPDLAPARIARATVDLLAWRWQDSLAEFRDVAGRPIVGVWQNYAFLSAYLGNPEEGLAYAERVLRLEPDALEPYWMRGIVEGYARDYDSAVSSLRKAQELVPANPLVSNWLAYMEIARGNSAQAAAHLAFSRRLVGDEINVAFWSEYAYAYHRLGLQQDAQRLCDDIQRVSAQRSIGAGTWAIVELALGNDDKALEWLRRVADKARNHEIDEGFFAVMNLRMNFTNDPLLEEPRFTEVLDQIRGD